MKKISIFLRLSVCLVALLLCGALMSACDFSGPDDGPTAMWSNSVEIVDGEIIAKFSDGKEISFGMLDEQIYKFEQLSDGTYAAYLDNSILMADDGVVIEQDGETYTLDPEQIRNLITQISFPDTYEGQPITMIKTEVGPMVSLATSSCFQSVSKVTIPKTVTVIGERAFYGFLALEEIELHEGIVAIERNAFGCCAALKEVTLPSTLIDLCEGAFYDCKTIKEFIIPDTVEYIGEGVVSGCSSLKYLKMPLPDVDTLTNGSYHWFGGFAGGCSNELVLEITGGDIIYGTMIGANDCVKKVIVHGVNEIESIAFNNCSNLEEIVLGADIGRISGTVDFECPNIKKITFEGPISTASGGAFHFDLDYYPHSVEVHFNGTKAEFVAWAKYDYYGMTVVCNDGTFVHTGP